MTITLVPGNPTECVIGLAAFEATADGDHVFIDPGVAVLDGVKATTTVHRLAMPRCSSVFMSASGGLEVVDGFMFPDRCVPLWSRGDDGELIDQRLFGGDEAQRFVLGLLGLQA